MDRISLEQLAERSGVPPRTVRYYIQRGLVDRPEGERRGAWYAPRHLEQLLRIRRWSEAGLSLEGITQLLQGGGEGPPPAARNGSIGVRSHVQLDAGLELVIDPELARLSSAEIRELAATINAAHQRLLRRRDRQEKSNANRT